VKQVVGFAILGIKNGKPETALALLQEVYDQMPDEEHSPEGEGSEQG
jgi:hypothetical protein